MRVVKENAGYLRAKLGSGQVIYGINTGFGGSADVRCSDTRLMQESGIRHQNSGKFKGNQKAATRSNGSKYSQMK